MNISMLWFKFYANLLFVVITLLAVSDGTFWKHSGLFKSIMGLIVIGKLKPVFLREYNVKYLSGQNWEPMNWSEKT